jgi:hypothetical protein
MMCRHLRLHGKLIVLFEVIGACSADFVLVLKLLLSLLLKCMWVPREAVRWRILSGFAM